MGEKLSTGFLQSLGAEPGKDVTTVIKELKAENVSLKKNVNELAETLARKSQSLLDALQAVDNINNAAEEATKRRMSLVNELPPMTPRSAGKMKKKVKAFHQRIRSKDLGKLSKKQLENDAALKNGKLPKPPKRRNSQIGLNGYSLSPKQGPHHRQTATFFKKAVGNETESQKLDLTKVKNGKELQFVSQQLTSDVATKAQNIENLEIANTQLLEQMQKMKKQMEEMSKNQHQNQSQSQSHTKNQQSQSISDLP